MCGLVVSEVLAPWQSNLTRTGCRFKRRGLQAPTHGVREDAVRWGVVNIGLRVVDPRVLVYPFPTELDGPSKNETRFLVPSEALYRKHKVTVC